MLYHFPSNCEKIITRSSYTLEELLDEDEVVTDVKEGKENIIAILLRPNNFASLISYLVSAPTPETSEKAQFRYPAVAFEILTSDIDELCDAVLENPKLLDSVIGYFEQIHSPTLSRRITLVSRYIAYLLKYDRNKMTKSITKREKLVPFLIRNIEIAGYITFITSLIQEEEYIVSWLIGGKFIPKLIENFAASESISKHSSSCTAILEILDVVQPKSRFVFELNTKDNVELLATYMFGKEQNQSALQRGLCIFQRLLQIRNGERQVYGVKKELPLIGALLVDKIHFLCQILEDPIPNPNGGDSPFGPLRLAILRAYKTLIEGNFPGVQEKLLNSKLFDIVLNSFAKYPKNNIFHAFGTQILSLSLQQRNAPEIINFLTKTNLVEVAIATENNPGKIRHQRWFHLICRVLIDRARRYMEVQEFLEQVVGWLDYSSMIITEKIKEDQFDREKLRDEGNYTKPEATAWKDDDVGVAHEQDRLMLEDVDIDSTTDAEEFEFNILEMSVPKFEIENFSVFVK